MLLCLVSEKLAVNPSLPFGLSNIRSRGDEEVQGAALSNGLCGIMQACVILLCTAGQKNFHQMLLAAVYQLTMHT